ncbi:hypothetical protein [Streptomyces sp. NPDC059009]|uniref:hypothetical protein n=1 Tax=Streptomyces sp. NPDC059009 TaxID=3346694 RepID=UPI0036B3AF94
MKDYIHHGEALPADLLERIADDVRAFDRIRTPEARTARALEKIADRALRFKVDVAELERKAERITLASEMAAAAAMGVPADDLYQLPAVRSMFMRLGLPLPPRTEEG